MIRLLVLLVISSLAACAQTAVTPAQAAKPASIPNAQELAAQFGPAFKVESAYPVLVADLTGDGKADAVIVATADEPLLDELEYHYKVVDPYNAYFGFGDPKITASFAAHEQHPHLLLVIDNWAAPQQKWVIINLTFEKLSLARVLAGKKPTPSIRAEEIDGMKSDIYWDGKKWKWKEESLQ